MEMITTIVVDEEDRDSAASHIASVLQNLGGAEIVALPDFLTKAGVQFDASSGNLAWDRRIFSFNFEHAGAHRICNRVVTISKGTTNKLDNHQHIVSSSMVFSHYARLLEQFCTVWGTPGFHSPVGNLLPLNLQWRLFNERVRDIETPRFVYAFGVEKVDVSTFRQPIWKSPFDLYMWKAAAAIKMPRFHTFVVDRPPGSPLVLYFVGDSANLFSLRSEDSIGEHIRSRLLGYMPEIKAIFHAFMGEALFFVDQDQLTFAAFSHYLKTSLDDERFSKVLEKGIEDTAANSNC